MAAFSLAGIRQNSLPRVSASPEAQRIKINSAYPLELDITADSRPIREGEPAKFTLRVKNRGKNCVAIASAILSINGINQDSVKFEYVDKIRADSVQSMKEKLYLNQHWFVDRILMNEGRAPMPSFLTGSQEIPFDFYHNWLMPGEEATAVLPRVPLDSSGEIATRGDIDAYLLNKHSKVYVYSRENGKLSPPPPIIIYPGVKFPESSTQRLTLRYDLARKIPERPQDLSLVMKRGEGERMKRSVTREFPLKAQKISYNSLREKYGDARSGVFLEPENLWLLWNGQKTTACGNPADPPRFVLNSDAVSWVKRMLSKGNSRLYAYSFEPLPAPLEAYLKEFRSRAIKGDVAWEYKLPREQLLPFLNKLEESGYAVRDDEIVRQ